MITKLTRANQVTIPVHVLRDLGLRSEEKLELNTDLQKGEIILRKLQVKSFEDLFEEAKRLTRGKKLSPMTAEEMDDAFDREVLEED